MLCQGAVRILYMIGEINSLARKILHELSSADLRKGPSGALTSIGWCLLSCYAERIDMLDAAGIFLRGESRFGGEASFITWLQGGGGS